MKYQQLTSEERYTLSTLRKQGHSQADIARYLGRHPSTISREIKRNRSRRDGAYRPSKAVERTHGRRYRSRRNLRIGSAVWAAVVFLLKHEWSPEQISRSLKISGIAQISHETIYRRIWADKKAGGTLYKQLRGSPKLRRKRYGAYDSRGRLAGKRHISERPKHINLRQEFGHWEIDTVASTGSLHCIVTLVERSTGLTIIGQLDDRTVSSLNKRLHQIIKRAPWLFKTFTADNGTEFHGYDEIEKTWGVTFYFCTPYHSWERGTNENTNGLIRQYLPKGTSMKYLTQKRCEQIAHRLNTRPRKRLGFQSPIQRARDVA